MIGHVLTINTPGPLCTVQDSGRPGFQRFGVSTSGAVDQASLILGNRLLGNDPNAPALEVTFGGFQAEFAARTAFAITGGDLAATLNRTEVSRYTVLSADQGDRLVMASPRAGLRAYLCISGGFVLPRVLGSASTYIPGAMGGLSGRALQAGDKLSSGETGAFPETGTVLDGITIPFSPIRSRPAAVASREAQERTNSNRIACSPCRAMRLAISLTSLSRRASRASISVALR